MFKLLFYLAVLSGIGYAALRVPVGGKTAVEHGRELVRWDAVAQKGSELTGVAAAAVSKKLDSIGTEATEAAKKAATSGIEAGTAAAREVVGSAAGAAAKDGARVVSAIEEPGSKPPAENLTQADRDALEKLLPR